MPRTWTHLHEHLGCPPGPVDFAMVQQCVADQLAEADDLDWKEALPNGQDPRAAGEFAKDVAAMANTRGGLIIYGGNRQSARIRGRCPGPPSGAWSNSSSPCPPSCRPIRSARRS